MPGPPRTLSQAVRFREDDRDRSRQSQMAIMVVEAQTKIAGSGEVAIDIKFPVVFAEKPHLSFGHELGPNQSPEATNFPVCSVTVLRWTTRELTDQRTFYVGATIGVVALGRENMRSVVHTTFRALAFRDPTMGPVALNEPI